MAEANGNGRTPWGLLASIVSVVVPVLVFSFWVGTIQASVAENKGRLEVTERRLAELEQLDRQEQLELATVCSSLVEVETQFRGADQVRDLMHLGDLRTSALLWRKVYGTDYPIGTPYLPTIARDSPSPCH